MTDADKLNALADRIEAAEGPDRELDDALFAAMGHCKHSPRVEAVEINGELELLTRCAKCGSANTAYPFHRYTASLDAAMTLVPEGSHIYLNGYKADHYWNRARVQTFKQEGETPDDAKAATPALALCAAALRALANTPPGGSTNGPAS